MAVFCLVYFYLAGYLEEKKQRHVYVIALAYFETSSNYALGLQAFARDD